MKGRRILLLDYARIGAAFLVIFGHLYDPTPGLSLRTFIYQFHMPLFFFVSGILHHTKSVPTYIRTLLVPLCFFVCAYYLAIYPLYHFGIWDGASPAQAADFGNFLLLTAKDIWGYFVNNQGLGPSWFLLALFYCKLIVHVSEKSGALLKNHPKASKLVGITIGFCLWILGMVFLEWYGCSIHKHGWRNVGYVANGLMAMPYYVAGMWFAPKISEFVEIFSARRSQGLFCAVACALLVYFCMNLNGAISMFAIVFGDLSFPENVIATYVSGFSGTFMILFLAVLIPTQYPSATPENNSPWKQRALKWTNISANALISIVGFQYFFCEIVRHTIGLQQPYLLSVLIAVVIFAICVGLHLFVMRFAPFLLGKGSRKRV